MDNTNQNMNDNYNFINNPLLNQNFYYCQNFQMNPNNFFPYFPQGINQMNSQFNTMQNVNPFFMPNLNLLNQMYMQSPFNINNQNNQNNQNILDFPLDLTFKNIKLYDLNNLSGKQLYLTNAVIQFYKSHNNIYMNFENPIQIQYIVNFLENKIDVCKYNNEKVEDPLYYINEQKKIINFINSNYIIYKVSIPIKITKFDLYAIARNYQTNKFVCTDALLIYNGIILENDKSSIDSFSENDFIKIIDIRNYPDNSYFNTLQSIQKNKSNFTFIFDNGKQQNLPLPEDIKISELLKAFYLKNGLENHYCRLVCNGKTLSQNDETKSNALFSSAIITIKAITMNNVPYTFGKLVKVHITYFEKKIQIGVFNSINYIISKNE